MALTASEPLQPIKERPAELPKVTGMPAHTYSMPPDASGFAKLRDTPVPIAPFDPRPAPPPTLQPAATLGTSQVFVLSAETLAQGIRLPEPVALKPQTVPRTTAWRQKKRMEQGLELKRKCTTPANLCSKCKKTKTQAIEAQAKEGTLTVPRVDKRMRSGRQIRPTVEHPDCSLPCLDRSQYLRFYCLDNQLCNL